VYVHEVDKVILTLLTVYCLHPSHIAPGFKSIKLMVFGVKRAKVDECKPSL
jgi:hypothetical protein